MARKSRKKEEDIDSYRHEADEIPTFSLHIHERIAPEAVIYSIKREAPPVDLFAKPEMPLAAAFTITIFDNACSEPL